MLKKLRKTLSKEFKARYEKMESHYLGLENRIYTTIEDRLSVLEVKFEELSELIKDEVRYRKERNEDKLEDMDQEEDGTLFSETVDDVKEVIGATIKEAKETVTEKVEEVTKQVDKAKKIVAEKLKKGKKKAGKAKKEVEYKVENTVDKVEKKAEQVSDKVVDDLTTLKGLGEKMSEKLTNEGITSYKQLATMTHRQVDELDDKIKSFAARFRRYDWGNQAKNQ